MTREFAENSGAGEDVGAPVEANGDAGETLTYTLEGTDAASLEIAATTGQIQTRSGVTYDFETKSSYSVTVTVADANTPVQTATTAVTIKVTDVNDSPALPISETGHRSMNENVGAGTSVGAPVSATDQDNDSLTYSLTGADAYSFDFVPTSGQIRTKVGVTYNHESKPSYSLTVNVSDSKDANDEADTAIDDSISVTVEIVDLNEAPRLTGPVSETFEENATGEVARYEA